MALVNNNISMSIAETASGNPVVIQRSNSGPSLYSGRTSASGYKELANSASASMAPGLGLPSGTQVGSITSPGIMAPLLDGFYVNTQFLQNRFYREAYMYDPTIGAGIELMSTMALGDFHLGGMSDERRLLKNAECVERLQIRHLLPALSTEFLVMGSFTGTMSWSSSEKMFTGISPQNIDYLSFEPSPVYGIDPTITLTLPQVLLAAINSGDPKFARYKDKLPAEFFEEGTGSVELNPDNTIFMARRLQPSDSLGVSIIRRCIPILLAERPLIRGTIDLHWKRQRNALHVVLEETEGLPAPTEADLQSVVNMLRGLDHDPTGAIMATRAGLTINEISRSSENRWLDQYEQLSAMKMRALGVSDALFMTDGSITNTDGAINIALQHLASYRAQLTRSVFYDKIFPAIAIANGHRKSQTFALSSAGHDGQEAFDTPFGLRRGRGETDWTAEFAADSPPEIYGGHTSKFSMPKVIWETDLASVSFDRRAELLTKMAEQGIPVPLRMWAAVSGTTLEAIAEQRDADIKMRKFFDPWNKLIAKTKAAAADASMGEGMDGGTTDESSTAPPFGVGSVPRSSLLDRFADPDFSVPFVEIGGKMKPRSKAERAAFNNKLHKNMNVSATEIGSAMRKKKNEAHAAAQKRKVYHAKGKGRKA